MPLPTPPPYALTVWSPSGIVDAVAQSIPTLLRVQPPCVVVHGTPPDIADHIGSCAITLRQNLPNVRLWIEIAGDWGPADAVQMAVYRDRAAQAAIAAAIDLQSIDLESRWHEVGGDAGFDGPAAAAWLARMASNFALLPTIVSTWPRPSAQPSYVWKSILRALGYSSQIYTSSADGLLQEFALYLSDWNASRAGGVVSAGPRLWPTLQAGGVNSQHVSYVADAFETFVVWVKAPNKADDSNTIDAAGEQLLRSYNALTLRPAPPGFPHYVGIGRVARFQADNGLKIDSRLGPATRAALGVT